MKKLVLVATLAGFFFTVNAQTENKMDKKEDKKEMKKHVCTAACKDGKHSYAHGEKGHVCTEACKKAK